jgi:hypothetical protein
MTQDNLLAVKFIKLRHGEDLIAYLIEETDAEVRLKRPLSIRIENNYATGRQMMDIREWLPPIVTDVEEINISKTDIMVMTGVRDVFRDEFEEVVNYFYAVRSKKKIDKNIGGDDDDNKVIPFILRDTSNKLN